MTTAKTKKPAKPPQPASASKKATKSSPKPKATAATASASKATALAKTAAKTKSGTAKPAALLKKVATKAPAPSAKDSSAKLKTNPAKSTALKSPAVANSNPKAAAKTSAKNAKKQPAAPNKPATKIKAEAKASTKTVAPKQTAKTPVTAKKAPAEKAPTKPQAAALNGKSASAPSKPAPAPKKPSEPVPPPSNTKPEIVAKIRSVQAEKELRKDLAQTPPKTSLTLVTPVPALEKGKDRLILMVRDPYWLHAHWDITRQSVERAKAALAENWHTVHPILRLLKLDDTGTTNNAETIFRDIEIHGGVRNWYIDVENPPSRFKMLMGYLCANGRFYELARSNTVSTPVPGGKEATDDHWADVATDAEHIYSMSGGYGDDTQTGDLTEVFEEKLKRTMDADVLSQFGSGAEGSLKRHKQFHFDVDAELVVFGSTHPDAHVSVGTEPVKVRNDGSFSIRMPLPDRRQVLPATAKSRDGVDEQTVVIAVERNTKVMEPLSSMDTDDL